MGAYLLLLFCLLINCIPALAKQQTVYNATWKSLDSRPLPAWYDEAKIGIFMHWGVFSVPSFGSEWFWWNWQGAKDQSYVDFMEKNYPPGFTYPDFAPQFTAELFNPQTFAEIIEAAGAKYFVLTSKHHEGFTNWPSNYSWNWNSMDVGPKRDLVGELAEAIRKYTPDVHFGLYHSMFEWFNPLWLQDQKNGFTTQDYVKQVCLPELHEIVNNYKPDVLWSDGEWEAFSSYWNSTEFLAWLYNESPVKDTVVTNDRWGKETRCKHGGFYTCSDGYNPGVLQQHKWENCRTVDRGSWGYRRNVQLSDLFDAAGIIQVLTETISCGGNLLLNIGPTADGVIVPIFEERLRQMGSWLKVNGEAIYASKPWRAQNDTKESEVWYTSQMNGQDVKAVYAIVLKWPEDNVLRLIVPLMTVHSEVTMLGYSEPLKWQVMGTGVMIILPALSPAQLPCKWAWVVKMTNIY